jgi:hypothetical protein
VSATELEAAQTWALGELWGKPEHFGILKTRSSVSNCIISRSKSGSGEGEVEAARKGDEVAE